MNPHPLPQSLRLAQYNVENLFLYLDSYAGQDLGQLTELEWQKLSSSSTGNKPLYKTKASAEAILDLDPDVLMLNEVGGRESLLNFNRLFLKDRYIPHIIEGNSDRGIDVAYLTKATLPFKFLLISHKNRPIDFLYPHEISDISARENKSHFFSRDVAELRMFVPGSHSPCLVILLTHLKSKLDPDGIDPEGRARREAELKTLVKVYNDVHRELEFKVPIVVAGDFNGEAGTVRTEPEFSALHEQTDLKDVFDLAGLADGERYTQMQFPRHGTPRGLHLDYIFLSSHLHKAVVQEQTGVYLYKSDLKVILPYPKSLDQRTTLASDHYPIFCTIKNWRPSY